MLEGFPLYFWEFLILNLPLYRLLMDTIDYPKGIGKDAMQPYMLLTSYESKNAISSVTNSEGKGIPISSIALYIPPNALKTAYTADWQGLEGGALRAAAGGAISDFVTGKCRGWSFGQSGENNRKINRISFRSPWTSSK